MNTLANYDVTLVLLSYGVAVLGSLTGLFVTTFIRRRDGDIEVKWAALGALVIGGCAVWSMHFIGMLAFKPGIPIAYDMTITLISLVIPIVLVFLALYTVFHWYGNRIAWLVSAVILGLGIAAMHYVGMAAMVMPAKMAYVPWIVALSVVIAIVAAAAALHILVHSTGMLRHFTSLVLGIAVCGMHYTGMAAMRLEPITGPDNNQYFQGTFTVQTMWIAVTLAVVTTCAIGGILAVARGLQDVSRSRRATA